MDTPESKIIQTTIELRALRAPWCRGVNLYLSATSQLASGQQRLSLAEPIIFKVVTDNCDQSEPTLKIHENAAQQFMDELWIAGFRPSAGHGSTGQLAAVQYHLEDMRKLVFKEQEK